MGVEESVGAKIRSFRKAKRLTISDLSKMSNISESHLSRVENGKTSAPVSTLNTIAKALGTKIGFFFDEHENWKDPKITVTKAKERIEFRKGMREFGYNYSALAPDKKNKLMEPFILSIDREKNPEQPVIFTHSGEEVIFVLEGEMLFTYEDQQFFLEKGDCVYFDATGSHMVKNIGNTALEFMIAICSA